jgi:hypothetical protein
MKFNSFISENKLAREKQFDLVISWLETIEKECSEYLKEFEFPFFRGTKQGPTFKSHIPRTDRVPLDTPKAIHDILDKEFKKKFGWKVRSEGVFVTSVQYMASAYGEVVMFFPVNGYKYVWSPEIFDLSVHISDLGDPDILVNYEDDFASDIVEKYRDSGAKNTKKEIAFKCKKWYGLKIVAAEILDEFIYVITNKKPSIPFNREYKFLDLKKKFIENKEKILGRK